MIMMDVGLAEMITSVIMKQILNENDYNFWVMKSFLEVNDKNDDTFIFNDLHFLMYLITDRSGNTCTFQSRF